MCVLSLAPSGKVQYKMDLENACLNNPDGFGYAIHTGRHILRRRSMDADYLIGRYLEDRNRFLDGPALFHARIATSGKVDNSGCHPFLLPGNAKVAIGHNGVLPLNMAKIGGWKSDTRFFVEDIVHADGGADALASPLYIAQAEKWMGEGNKMVVLSADRRLPPFTILNEKSGHWDDGIWWSNYTYSYSKAEYTWSKDYTWKTKSVSTSSADDSIIWEDVECEWCSGILTEAMMEDGQCGHCWADLLDEPHVDSAWCACYQCENERAEELDIVLSREETF